MQRSATNRIAVPLPRQYLPCQPNVFSTIWIVIFRQLYKCINIMKKDSNTPALVMKFPNITFTTVLYVDAINGLLKFKICVHT